jgi:hypothetical protein
MVQEIKYDGDVLTDVTSFSMVQNIFDGKKEINKSQIESLDSIIQLLVFYDNIWIIKPALFGVDITTETQGVLNDLIQNKVIQKIPEFNIDNQADFETQYNEIEKIISPLSIEEYYDQNNVIANDLQVYNENFNVAQNPKALEFGRLAHLDEKYLPLCANLLRSNHYLKQIQQIKQNEGKIVTYSPNILRTSLVRDIVEQRDDNINRLLREQIAKIESPVKEGREYLTQRTHKNFDLELPLLTSIIVSECKNKEDFIPRILAWRKDGDAIKVRGWLKQVQGDICNNRMEKIYAHINKLDDYTKSIEAKSTTKANLASYLSDPAFIDGTAASAITSNPIPMAAGVVHSAGKNFLKPLMDNYKNRDLFLFMKMKEKAAKNTCEKEQFERIFGLPPPK